MRKKTLLVTAGALIGGAALYRSFLRAPILTWGATRDEVSRRLPGDELLEEADGTATRAVTINAPPSAVWPWIAQMGLSPRGGAYTYDWIENLLGLNMHSVDHVLPEFQHPKVGDGFGYGPNKMSFRLVEPEHVLAAQSEDSNWVWTFVIEETQDGKTRLISRNRFRLPKLKDKIGMIPMEPASLVMERRMLHGIKKRAENLGRSSHEGPNSQESTEGSSAMGDRTDRLVLTEVGCLRDADLDDLGGGWCGRRANRCRSGRRGRGVAARFQGAFAISRRIG